MKKLILAALLFAACSETDNPADSNPPPPNQAVHDTVALHTPPAPVATLGAEYTARLSMINVQKSLVIGDYGAYVYQTFVPCEVRVGDSSRVWFRGENLPFNPYRMTFNGVLAGDSITGWFELRDMRDGGWSMHPMTMRKRYGQ